MSKAIAQKKFGRFVAEILPNDDREGVNCFVTSGKACSSLAVIEDHGYIEPMDSAEIFVPESVIDQIRTWAESHGY